MGIKEHPVRGSILICDFNSGFKEPEMVKLRPVIVISQKIHGRPGLCTVVSLSTSAPVPVMPYHAQIDLIKPLPPKFKSTGLWVKGDMVYAVGFHRLDSARFGKDKSGKRNYYYETLNSEQMKIVERCVLRGLGLSSLTKHL